MLCIIINYFLAIGILHLTMDTTKSSTPSIYPVLVLCAVGGAAVLASYVYFLPRVFPKKTAKSISALWFGIDGDLRNVYYVSIVLTALAFLVSLVWLLVTGNTHAHQNIHYVFAPYAVFLAGALLWSVALWTWGHNVPTWWLTQTFVVLALTITTAGAVWLLVAYVRHLRAPWWVCVFVAYVLFHVGVLDNIGWTTAFLRVQS